MAMSPLDDNSMYLQLAQQAAAKGNPSNAAPMPGPSAPEAIPPQVIHAFVLNLPKVIPNITPQQAAALVKLLQAAFAGEDALEGPEPPAAMETQPGAV